MNVYENRIFLFVRDMQYIQRKKTVCTQYDRKKKFFKNGTSTHEQKAPWLSYIGTSYYTILRHKHIYIYTSSEERIRCVISIFLGSFRAFNVNKLNTTYTGAHTNKQNKTPSSEKRTENAVLTSKTHDFLTVRRYFLIAFATTSKR